MKIKRQHQRGHVLITLLLTAVVGIIVSTAATNIVVNNAFATSSLEQSIAANDLAETGIENAMIRLLRNPSYTGETLMVDGSEVEITVTGTTQKTITSSSSVGDFQKTIVVTADYVNYTLNITSWNEQ